MCKTDDLRKALTEAGVAPQYIDMFLAGVSPVDTENRKELHVLIEKPARKGKAAVVVSRRFRNILTEWDKPLKLATQLSQAGGGAIIAERALEHLWVAGSGGPWGAVSAAIVGILLAWKATIGAMEIELSNAHAAIIYYLFRDCKDTGATLRDVHATFDATLGATTVEDVLTDLSELGVIGFNLDRIELREKLIAA
jgi:hypothetical protein